MEQFRKASEIAVPASDLEQWHHSPGAFHRLTPPWERIRVEEEPEGIENGTRAVIAMKAGPFWTKWIAEHEDCRPGQGFSDVQIKGPFASWKHVHRFNRTSDDVSELIDEISYRLPGGFLGQFVGGRFVRGKLERTFRYRHAMTRMDLERHALEPQASGDPLTVLVTGGTGMVGTALEGFLRMRGHRVVRVTRRPTRPDDLRWDIAEGELDLSLDQKIDAVVHLAGENVAGGRWTTERKRRILESRRLGTRLLCQRLAEMQSPPKVLISASGVNYYAQGTAEPQDESAERGRGFLSDVSEVWENETLPAANAGIRVVQLRLGVVLSPTGGALAKMLPAFRLGAAGKLGSGKQRMAWIALDDVVDIIHWAVLDPRYEGAVNAVAPSSPTNVAFTRSLSKALRRPAWISVPAPALRLALGKQMADETLLADLAITPAKLGSLGYPFRFREVSEALTFMLGVHE